MKHFHIDPVTDTLRADLQRKIDYKTKPLGALGRLEELALQIGRIQGTLSPSLKNPHIIVFAADHGIAHEGVSAYPQAVTYQMVMNFVNGGAAINVFCQQHGIALKIVDAGVNHEFPKDLPIRNAKVGMGTKSFLAASAMSMEQAERCIENGAGVVEGIARAGCNVIGFGDMGIANTASASALMSVICKIPVESCIGRGTGLDDQGIRRKTDIVTRALAFHGCPSTPFATLATFGGFEIGQICGAMLQAAEKKMLLLVDGFIATAAFLVAHQIAPTILDYAIFCHQSDESGHARMLEYLNAQPLLKLDMRLGEGTGVAVAFPLIQSAVNFLNEMASFESAGVSSKQEAEQSA
jgi:nicotinate-nucleotide--dimethylbenzimidazole phosphoribosyltransferase